MMQQYKLNMIKINKMFGFQKKNKYDNIHIKRGSLKNQTDNETYTNIEYMKYYFKAKKLKNRIFVWTYLKGMIV